MPFEEGQSGNPGGRPKRAKLTYDAMQVELKTRESSKDPKGIRKIVCKVIDLAEEGERWAVEFVRDTTDGRPAQAIVGGDDDDNPINLVHRIERVIVRPKD